MAETIGVVGVGLLGSAVSGVLLDAGHPLVVHDVVAEKVDALVARVLRAPKSAIDLLKAALAQR